VANNPLFVADLATIKARLRLTGVPAASTDTHAIIDECLLRTRLTFVRRLGTARINKIRAITYTEDPLTDDGVIRALANTTEINMVRCELMQRLPIAFMDASADLDKRWNEDAPFREKGSNDLRKQITDLQNSIEEDMQMLAGEEELAEESTIQIFDGVSDLVSPRPGDTLRTYRRCSRLLPED
jgi:hypothetical protein